MGTNALLRDGGEINIQQSNGRSVSSLRQGPLCGASLDHLVGAHEQGDNRPQGIAHYGCRPNMTFRMQASRWRTKGSSFRDFCGVLLYVSRPVLFLAEPTFFCLLHPPLIHIETQPPLNGIITIKLNTAILPRLMPPAFRPP